jgi:lipopolysaccharide/colanic/teichoic acid biosynthesis glycosyltransferase
MKRLFDFIISLFGVVVLFPLFIIVSLLIKLSDKGPILFKQKRIGKSGKPFFLYKFRSMKSLQINTEGIFGFANTTQITSIGKFLRKTKLDELPQIINVLFGQMSLVGPRPEVKKWTKVYPDKWEIVHSIKPGMTDNASIEFNNEEELLAQSPDPEDKYLNVILPRKLDLYIDYVNNHTFKGDILIILRTIKAVLFR